MVKALAGNQKGALGLVQAGKAVARGLGVTTTRGVIQCLLRLYNKGLGKGKLRFE